MAYGVEGKPHLVRLFEEAEQASDAGRRCAERDRDYKDNKQWTSAERRTLEKRKQPVVTYNRIARKVDFLCGMETQQRKDPKAFPRTPGDEGAAQAATDALRFICDQSDWDRKRSEAVENIIVEGTGAIMVGARRGKDGIDPDLIHIPWDRLFWDPHSRRLDFSDATYMGIVTWMDEAEALTMYGDSPEAVSAIRATMEDSRTSETYDDRPKFGIWADFKRRRVRIIEGYYLIDKVWHMCIATKGGEIVPTMPSPYLDEDGKPENPIKAVSYYIDRDNDRYGGVRVLIGPQDEINKRRSKALHLITMRQFRMARGSGTDADTVKKELAKPDGGITADKDEFEVLPTNDMAAANLQMLQEAKAEIDLLGPNAALTGKNENDMSGRAILAQQQGGMVEVAMLFDRLRCLSLAVYRSVWARIRQYWTGERWIRVTDDERNLRFVGLNRPITMMEVAQQQIPEDDPQRDLKLGMLARDPMANEPIALENSVAELDVDIVIDEGMDTPTVQAEQFDTLLKTLPALGPAAQTPVALQMIVEASSLRNKEKLLQLLSQGHEQPQIPPELIQQLEAMGQAIQELRAANAEKDQALADKTAQNVVQAGKVAVDQQRADTEQFKAETERVSTLMPDTSRVSVT